MTFFAVVNVVLVGAVVIGIVNSAFDELRERQRKLDDDRHYQCYMCSLTRADAELGIKGSGAKRGAAFDVHRNHVHNVGRLRNVLGTYDG